MMRIGDIKYLSEDWKRLGVSVAPASSFFLSSSGMFNQLLFSVKHYINFFLVIFIKRETNFNLYYVNMYIHVNSVYLFLNICINKTALCIVFSKSLLPLLHVLLFLFIFNCTVSLSSMNKYNTLTMCVCRQIKRLTYCESDTQTAFMYLSYIKLNEC